MSSKHHSYLAFVPQTSKETELETSPPVVNKHAYVGYAKFPSLLGRVLSFAENLLRSDLKRTTS